MLAMKPYKRILVGYDGSPASDLAFYRGKSLALQFAADLIVLSVVDTPHPARHDTILYVTDQMSNSRKEEAVAKLRGKLYEFQATCRQEGIACRVRLDAASNLKEHIVHVIESQYIDLVLLGNHGIGGAFSRLLTGSTTLYLISKVKCDVLVVTDPGSIHAQKLDSENPVLSSADSATVLMDAKSASS